MKKMIYKLALAAIPFVTMLAVANGMAEAGTQCRTVVTYEQQCAYQYACGMAGCQYVYQCQAVAVPHEVCQYVPEQVCEYKAVQHCDAWAGCHYEQEYECHYE